MEYTEQLDRQIHRTLREINNLESLVNDIESKSKAIHYYNQPWKGATEARESIIKAENYFCLVSRANYLDFD